jgi:hypothetical protein
MGRKRKKKLQADMPTVSPAVAAEVAATNKAAEPVAVPPSTGPVSEPAPDAVSTQPEEIKAESELVKEEPIPSEDQSAPMDESVLTPPGSEPMPEQTSEIQPEAPATEETTDVSQEAATYLAELKERALHIEGELNSMDTPEANVEALETELAGIKSQIAELDPESEIDM